MGEGNGVQVIRTTPASIIHVVLAVTGVPHEDFFSDMRHPDIVRCREAVVILSRDLTDYSFQDIAKAMGRPNHSTIITAYQRVTERLQSDSDEDLALYRTIRSVWCVFADEYRSRLPVRGNAAMAFLRDLWKMELDDGWNVS